jgi:serine/threonine protein kinase
MRLMNGGALSDRIQQGPVSLIESAAILARIGAALDKAHSRGIIHRDVKPSNILFDDDGDAYLSDFGIAKLTEGTAHLTGSGFIGTPSYMAPEMAQGKAITPLVDVYALGVMLFQMLTGEVPYRADTPMSVVMAHISKPIPDIRALRPELPYEVQGIIERALAKNPADRYQNAREMAADLKAAAALSPVSAFVQPPPVEASTLLEAGVTPVEVPSELYSHRGPTVERQVVKPRRKSLLPGWMLPAFGAGILAIVVCGAAINVGLRMLSQADQPGPFGGQSPAEHPTDEPSAPLTVATHTSEPAAPAPEVATEEASPTGHPVEACLATSDVDINARSGPSIYHPMVRVFPAHEPGTVTGRSADSTWWQIDSEVWVSAPFVELSGSCDNLPLASFPPSPFTPLPTQAPAATRAPTAVIPPTRTATPAPTVPPTP